MMLSLQTDSRQQPSAPSLASGRVHQAFQSSTGLAGASGLGFVCGSFGGGGDRLDESTLTVQPVDVYNDIKPLQLVNQLDVDDGMHLGLAHQSYKAGKFKQALEHCSVIYEKNPQRKDILLLLGAIYYQLHDYDMCIARNEEALAIDPHFSECYGNMANAWKEKGNIDLAIHYYQVALE